MIENTTNNKKNKLFNKEEAFNSVKHLLIDQRILWHLLFWQKSSIEQNDYINIDNVCRIIYQITSITTLAKDFNIDISNFKNLLMLEKICNIVDNKTIALLDMDVIMELFENTEEYDINRYFNKVCTLASNMALKSKKTVPFIKGQIYNYNYSLYDTLDETILLSGIKTDACFKIEGYDNDFFHYCALNKNGFVIKITNLNNDFIARASGFRHGNCVYLNQLRTIYDTGGEIEYVGCSESEKNDIVATLKKACEDIINISQNNEDEKDKIEYVFITKSYLLYDYDNDLVSTEVMDEIADSPMDTSSSDWDDYYSQTSNINNYGFATDYGSYEIICMASSNDKKITAKNIQRYDAAAVYERPRNRIIITDNPTTEVYKKINKIKAIKCYDEQDFSTVKIAKDSLVFVGDNWYIISDNKYIIDYLCLDDDCEKTSQEFNVVFEKVKRMLEQKNVNISEILNEKYNNLSRKEEKVNARRK